MAASDKTYRNQNTLDIVFAVTSILMLISVIMMFAQDYNREFKREQRVFRDVESAVSQRLALDDLPSVEEFVRAQELVETSLDKEKAEKKLQQVTAQIEPIKEKIDAKKKLLMEKKGEAETEKQLVNEIAGLEQNLEPLEKLKAILDEQIQALNETKLIPKYQAAIEAILPTKEVTSQKFQLIKADLESKTSFYNIAIDEGRTELANQYAKEIVDLEVRLTEAKKEKDSLDQQIQAARENITKARKPRVAALSEFKRVNEKLDTQVTAAVKKQWTVYDLIRSMPILDGFASPYKIKQYTLENVPIDYNFKQATRFDRCTTCHQGIDRPAYTKEMIAGLTEKTDRDSRLLTDAREALARRKQTLKGLPEARNAPSAKELDLNTLPKSELPEARVNEYCAHPRLDLYVGANSKHPSEKFGCTACHAGQGSATSFNLASHTPNDPETQRHWVKSHDWASNHYWDYPMLPQRFIESSCLKCHHEVTGVIGRDNRNEAPKLVRGYNLIKEVGCFGCHEINGRLKGKEVGPDLRLEHSPPLDELPAADRAKILSDPETVPGNLRKVGPSLFRIAEKTNADWTMKWLKSPREFRPTTKMPHFYMTANNDPAALKGTGQELFPDAEISSIAYYLFQSSENYLNKVKTRHAEDKKNPELAAADQARYTQLKSLPKLDAKDKAELDEVWARIQIRQVHELRDLAAGEKGDAKEGRILFSERGCLACHSHQGTSTAQGEAGKPTYSPVIVSEADFGPDLSQVKAKLGSKPGDAASARVWLIQWLLDPHVHSPRSRMPITHLTPKQAADIAAWLLDQNPTDFGPLWDTPQVAVNEPEHKTLSEMTQGYFKPLLSATNIKKLTENKLDKDIASTLPQEERELALKNDFSVDNLKLYIGKKAVGRLGCFGCHDVPGYENAKPIGTGLNDWGKKAPDRLAFEDIINYVKSHYHIESEEDEHEHHNGDAQHERGKDTKKTYEQYFFDELMHHSRIGYLHQKLNEPRSYDYKRFRSWQDRARMPQFKFARVKKNPGEMAEEYAIRADKEEAAAREAVMTFVLGLTAESLPAATIYHASGDRLAEMKGREVLDNFNCAGCHVIRPGVFEFKLDQKALAEFTKRHKIYSNSEAWKGDHVFYNHNAWVSEASPNPPLKAFGVRPSWEGEDSFVRFTSTSSLRFRGADGKSYDFRAFDLLQVPPSSMIYPPQSAMKSVEDFDRFVAEHGTYGGTFADLLVNYLVAKDEGNTASPMYPMVGGDSPNARIAAPPLLLRQGERTQPEWLYQFLLDPHAIRKATVLRMPKFNMSKEDARAIVNYFAAVDRTNNPGIGLKYPYEEIPQQQDLDSPYWRQKTAEYVSRLEQSKLLDKRVKDMEPVWQQILADYEQQLKAADANAAEMNKLVEPMEKEIEKVKSAISDEKQADKKSENEAQLKKLENKLKEPKQRQVAWTDEAKRLKSLVADSTIERQRDTWKEKEAYITDAYRLVVNPQLCLTCHNIGGLQASKQTQQGPPLNLAHSRLRPEWARWWIAHPQRFLTYTSVMPNNFPANATGYQQYFAGQPIDQITAARDLLMIYPQAAEMPANRYWALPNPKLPLAEGDTK